MLIKKIVFLSLVQMQPTYAKIHWYKLGQKEKAILTAKIKALLAKEEKVQAAWIFGGFTRSSSVRDINVAIHAEPELSFKEYLNLNAQIELELGIPVYLIEITKAQATLKESILKNGAKIKETKTP